MQNDDKPWFRIRDSPVEELLNLEDSLKNWDQYHKPGEHVKPGPHGSLMHSIFPADQLGIGVLQVHVLPGSPTL